MHKKWRLLYEVVLFVLGLCLIPHRWCARQAGKWFLGDASVQQQLARGVAEWVRDGLPGDTFSTGSTLFNQEWVFGTYMMAGMGFGQTALQHPDWRREPLELMDLCAERLLSNEGKGFDLMLWNEDPISSLSGESDHAAYLGYFNLLLSLHRLVDPGFKYTGLNDRITEALARRMQKTSILLLQTYPGETFPVDNCAVIGSIGLYDRATGHSHAGLLRTWSENFRRKYIDASTGLLYQSVDYRTGTPVGAPRGSGTALAVYLLSFADERLSRELYRASRQHLAGSVLGFGMVREYRRGRSGWADLDSGPLVLGYGPSATAFFISGTRIYGDAAYFSQLYASVYLFGSPDQTDGRLHFAGGGPLGDAILFAMLTAAEVPH